MKSDFAVRSWIAAIALALLAGCAPGEPSGGIADELVLYETLGGTTSPDEACRELLSLCETMAKGCLAHDVFCTTSSLPPDVCTALGNLCAQGSTTACGAQLRKCSTPADGARLDAGLSRPDTAARPAPDTRSSAPDAAIRQPDLRVVASDSGPIDEYGAGGCLQVTGNPVGGGKGYTLGISKSDSRVKYVVDTASELLAALQSARAGEVVYVEGTANIDMTGNYNVRIPAGVTLASNRGENGAAGGRIFQRRSSGLPATAILFRVNGQNVRISGLRIEGPDKTTSWLDEKTIGIYCSYRHLEVDNCEIWGWNDDGISLSGTGGADMKSGGYIHHNNIHHCQMDGLGYGIVVSNGAMALIEANYFDYNRHSIAGTGLAGDGYEARYNICGPNCLSTSPHNFDMHGKPDPANSSRTIAGDTIRIHHNTFMATQSLGAYPVAIRGVPRVGAYIDHNWFHYTLAAPVWQTDGREKIFMTDNLIGEKKTLSASGPIKYN